MSLQIPRLRKAVELEKTRADHITGFFQMLFFQFKQNPKVGQGRVEGFLLSKCFSVLALSPGDLSSFQALQHGCPQKIPYCPEKSRLRAPAEHRALRRPRKAPGDLLFWGLCQETFKQHTGEVPTLQCPGLGAAQEP